MSLSLYHSIILLINTLHNIISPLTGGWHPCDQAPRPRSVLLHFGFIPSHSTRLMKLVTLHHFPSTQTLAHGAPLGKYVTRNHLVTWHLAFGSKMLCPRPPNTCRYTWPRPHLALVLPRPPSTYITPLAQVICPLTFFDGKLLIWERDPCFETIVMYCPWRSVEARILPMRPMGAKLLTNILQDRYP